MFLFKKEKEVVDLLLKHLDVVEVCLTTGIKTIQTYLKGDTKEAKELAKEVDKIESEADLIRYEIRDKLYAGAYLPRLREDIYRLVEAVDEVVNAGETCSDFFLNQRPVIPEELKVMFRPQSRNPWALFLPLSIRLRVF